MASPASATPAQRVAVANRILATQGPGARPSRMSRTHDQQNDMPVGALSHFMTYLVSELETGV